MQALINEVSQEINRALELMFTSALFAQPPSEIDYFTATTSQDVLPEHTKQWG